MTNEEILKQIQARGKQKCEKCGHEEIPEAFSIPRQQGLCSRCGGLMFKIQKEPKTGE